MIRLLNRDLRETYQDEQGVTRYYKIIIYCDYYEVIDGIRSAMSNWNILEITGRIKDVLRPQMITSFNEDNDNNRILLANPVVGGLSINLQDKTGRHRRKTYIMPGYRINELHQASRRTDRDGAIGECYVRFVYGLTQQGSTEVNILTALARKGKVMHEMMEEQRAKFPGEYEDEYEVDPRTIFWR